MAFRWNLAKREQLGALLHAVPRREPIDEGFSGVLRAGAARILALSEGADLAFVGRTPESYFDYLSGAFCAVPKAPKLALVPFSMRALPPSGAPALPAHDVAALAGHFQAAGVDPLSIVKAPGRVAMVDFVASGGTYKSLCSVLHRMAAEAQVEWHAVQRKLMLIGLVRKGKNSPKTWRWQQHQDWLDLIPDTVIRNVSVEEGYMLWFANTDQKTTPSFRQWRWAQAPGRQFDLRPDNVAALADAVQIYDFGASKTERARLARAVAETDRMSVPATRQLISALRAVPRA